MSVLDALKGNVSDVSDYSSVHTQETELRILIDVLRVKFIGRDPSVAKIKYPKLLMRALLELDDMIGMDRLKESISLQIMKLIEALNSGQRSPNMLNTILYGPPGVGKTKVGIILAKIWHALGYLQAQPSAQQEAYLANEPTFNPQANLGKVAYALPFIIIGIYLLTYVSKGATAVYGKFGLTGILIIGGLLLVAGLAAYYYYYIRPKLLRANDKSVFKETDNRLDDPLNLSSSNNKDSTPSLPGPGNKNKPNQNKAKEPLNLGSGADIDDRDIITVVSRRDFVADYVGQTSGKTKRLLLANLGKVVFIDEAYSLLNDSRDSFGQEALTQLNLFMSQNPHGIVVIFAGYKDLLQQGIFKQQPGLPRRCIWHFECEGYTGDQLAEIFVRQLNKEKWNIDNRMALTQLISNNIHLFPSYGGDTERLSFFSQLEASRGAFLSKNKNKSLNKLLTIDQIKRGLERLKDNNIHKEAEKVKFGSESDNLFEMLKKMHAN